MIPSATVICFASALGGRRQWVNCFLRSGLLRRTRCAPDLRPGDVIQAALLLLYVPVPSALLVHCYSDHFLVPPHRRHHQPLLPSEPPAVTAGNFDTPEAIDSITAS